MTRGSISFRSSRRCAISHYLIPFMIFSLFGLCTSEALVSSSTSFLPRSLWGTRGGSQEIKSPKNQKNTLRSVLQVPRSSLAGTLGDSEDDATNTKRRNFNVIRKQKINASNGQIVDYVDTAVPAEFIAETNLPTDVGQFRLRAYRIQKGSNEFAGTEPCVIYSADKSPFGISDSELRQDLPVRIHDQCMTSEVFRSQR